MTNKQAMVAVGLFTFSIAAAGALSGSAAEVRFNRQIRPLLSDHCFACHGPDTGSREADLRLDTREGSALASEALVPGDADASELIARIMSDDPDVVMPPPDFHKPLNENQKTLLATWIDDGAVWEKHWSFVKPNKADLPRPEGFATWARNPIDHFVLARIVTSGLQPNAPADRYSLARRLALDLTGLPPNKAMLDRYLADADDVAYERYVNALLSSHHAGEHRTRYWLDAARYGDTHGMHVDNYREIWPYRDWVIDAFNANMPFDQFVREQIAGDLLPTATRAQQIATGFNRCNITTSEGGAIPAELNVRYMVDRVETTATVFLGLTAGCAVCHDHKYDPISQREFYRLGAFFNNTTQPAMDGNMKDTPPVIALPDAEFQEEWNHLETRRDRLRAGMHVDDEAVAAWWSARNESRHSLAADRLALHLPFTEGAGDTLELAAGARWADDHPAGKRGVRFGQDSELTVDFPQLRSDQPITISFWLRTPDRLMATTVFEQTAQTDKDQTVGWQVTSNTAGALTFKLTDKKGNSIRGVLPDNEALKPRAWQHVCIRYSGGQSNSSISVLANGRAASLRNSTEDRVEVTDLAAAPLKVAGHLPTAGLSDVRIYQRWLSDDEAELLTQEFQLKRLLASNTRWADLSAEERDLVANYYGHSSDATFQTRARELAETQRRWDYIYSRSTTTLVMQELDTPPRAWVLERGEYTLPKEQVTPDVPSVLPELPRGAPRNRLGLALWLTDADHPLLARVMVNRLWQSVFGTGLVKTSEDFGVMGERPSHPELLDWLAVEFIESGWNVNHILKLIVTSATYRQSSTVTADTWQRDADNRLLARGPRLRLDAEVLRDQALAVSGLLRRDIGGPSVKPYQPSGLWNVVAITGSNTRVFQADTGDALYRRSLYIFWKRTSPPPTMAAFNAPTREQCTVRRERTNTPLQALVLMNDPQFVEAARHLAERAISTLSDAQQRATWMLTTALGRPADLREVDELVAAAKSFKELFQSDNITAQALVETGDSQADQRIEAAELAAWTMIANTIMNRDDFINK